LSPLRLDEKTVVTDGKDDTRDPVAERSDEKIGGQGIPKTVQEVKGESIKDTHASDHTKSTQTDTLEESKAAKGITKKTESAPVQKGQEAESDKIEDKSEDKDESKSDEPTDKEIQESTELALVSLDMPRGADRPTVLTMVSGSHRRPTETPPPPRSTRRRARKLISPTEAGSVHNVGGEMNENETCLLQSQTGGLSSGLRVSTLSSAVALT
jgi:hypothetical protein